MVLGIDLGTTNSSAAVIDGTECLIVPNDRGSRVTPSVVAFANDGTVLVGESAKNQAIANPSNTIFAVKRKMGSDLTIAAGGNAYTPEEISARILAKLKLDAEAFLGNTIKEAVITVPAYFSDKQRRATQEAGRLAGLAVRRVINEPTAAAIAYAYMENRGKAKKAEGAKSASEDEKRIALVYDLGGGTFDVTILEMRGRQCRVLASRGDSNLGGIDFDELLLNRCLGEFRRQSEIDIKSDPMLMQSLRELVERAKIELSISQRATIALPFAGMGSHLQYEMDRKDFEALIVDLVERSMDLVGAALAEAEVASSDVGALILSGGSSRIPLVKKLLSQRFSLNFSGKINPDEVVAFGAAVEATLIDSKTPLLEVKEVAGRSYGVETDGGVFVPIIKKNSPIPTKMRRVFTTVCDDQTEVEIHMLQGESESASSNLSLGRFLLSGIRKGKKGLPRIAVDFVIDRDDILHVSAKDMDTGALQSVSMSSRAGEGKDGSEQAKAKLPDKLDSLRKRLEGMESEMQLPGDLSEELREAREESKKAIRSGSEIRIERAIIMAETLLGELDARARIKGA